MGKIVKDRIIYGGIDSALQNKVGSASLDTVAQDLSGAVNELKASGGGGNVDDVYVNGVSVLDSNKIAQITETDQNVLQTQDDSTDNNFEILLAGSTSTFTATEGAKKTSGLVFNPLQQAITIGSRRSNSTIGEGSFASGYNVEASLSYTHAEGSFTEASGAYAHAEGGSTIAYGDCSHAEGDSTEASGYCAHAEGHHTTASSSCAHADGDSTTASGSCAHAEGYNTKASGDSTHAEGGGTEASGSCAHAEGSATKASGNYAHAEGSITKASGNNAHAEGNNTEASGLYSHAEGGSTKASGSQSHAEGYNTVANHKSQHVFGEYNIADPSAATASDKGNYVEIVGNGTSSARSNARTLDWDGNEVLSGKLTVGAAPTNNMDVTTKQYVDTGLANKQDTLTAGTGINIDANNVISATGGGTITDVQVDGVSVVTSGVAEIDLTGKADAATTLAGYGITDANINNGTITLGSNTITPLTSHQDISGKVDKAGDTMTGALTVKNGRVSFIKGRDGAGIKNTAYNGDGAWYPVSTVKSKDGSWEYGTLSGSNILYFSYAADSNYSANSNKTNKFKLVPIDTNDHEYTIAHSGNVATGDSNGQIKIAGTNVSVKGLGSAAYLDATTAATASKVVQRDANGYIYCSYLNTTCGEANPSSYTNPRACFISSDNWIRRASAANFRSMIGAGTSSLTIGTTASTAAAGNHTHSNYQTTLSSTSANTGGGGTAVRKYGNVCWMPLFGCQANKVGTIPSGYRPGVTARAIGLCIVSSKVYYCVLEVNTGGAFKVWYYSTYPGSGGTEIQSTTNALYGEMIWIT